MRLGAVIILLAACAVALVHIRRAETTAKHETERLRRQQVRLRNKLWDQHIRLESLTLPDAVLRRVEAMGLQLAHPENPSRTEPDDPEAPSGPRIAPDTAGGQP